MHKSELMAQYPFWCRCPAPLPSQVPEIGLGFPGWGRLEPGGQDLFSEGQGKGGLLSWVTGDITETGHTFPPEERKKIIQVFARMEPSRER